MTTTEEGPVMMTVCDDQDATTATTRTSITWPDFLTKWSTMAGSMPLSPSDRQQLRLTYQVRGGG